MVDGLDGSGKSTVARWIKEYYEARGDSVLVQAHPSDRLAGRLSRRALQERGPMMFVVSTAFYVLDVLVSVAKVRTEFKKYDDVVFVRYLMGTAYLPKNLARQGYDVFAKVLPVPERLLLVDIDPEKALRRMACREDQQEMFENLPSLRKCREKILMLSGGWKVLDNNGDETGTRRLLEEQLEVWDRTLDGADGGTGTGPAAPEGELTSG